MYSSALIGIDGRRPNYFRKLARSIAPNEIHLEKTVLTVDKTKRKRQVKSITPGYRWDSRCVPDNTDGCCEIGRRDLTIQLRQAGTYGQPRQSGDHHNGGKKGREQTNYPTLHGQLIGGRNLEDFHCVGTASHTLLIALGKDDEVVDLNKFVVQQSLEDVRV